MSCQKKALVALGANLPFADLSAAESLNVAIARIPAHGMRVVAQSAIYQTPCFPPGAGPDYANAAVVLDLPDAMTASDVLHHLHAIEAGFDRRRETRWGMRTLDLDLIALEDLILPDRETHDHWRMLPPLRQGQEAPKDLILPHPRLQDRAFVLVPLAEIAPDWRHPILDLTVAQMRDALPAAELAAIKPFQTR
jgi:2-amino-4-hydroxy-6-hydroxymethyldihydropteridine diphosphokinase